MQEAFLHSGNRPARCTGPPGAQETLFFSAYGQGQKKRLARQAQDCSKRKKHLPVSVADEAATSPRNFRSSTNGVTMPFLGLQVLWSVIPIIYDEEKQVCAARLIESMELYGTGLARLAYQSETSVISSILRKWEKEEELKNAIAALDLTAWVEELNEANTLFDKRFLARIKEQTHHPEVTIAELRKEVIELFRILQDHIKAHAIISKDPRYDALIKEINF